MIICVNQQLSFCIAGDSFLHVGTISQLYIEAVVNFLQWYQLACRSKEFNEESLTTMDTYMRR